MSLLDDVLRLLGTNRIRLRWRWQQLRDKAARQKRAVANRSQALTYEHQLCPSCGHPEAKGDKVCSRCGARLHGVAMSKARRAASWILPEGVPVATIVYLAACVAMYFVTIKATQDYLYATGGETGGLKGLSPGSLEVIRFGANFRELVASGEYWRLVTANFLHASPQHIAMNAYGLWVAGSLIEDRFGSARATFLLIVTGIAGAYASYRFGGGFSLGASTAGFGLMGFVVGHALRFRGRATADLRERFVPWLLFGIIITFADSHIDKWGHIGGVVAGLLFGLVIHDKQQARRWPAAVWNVLAFASVAVAGWALYMAAIWKAPPGLAEWFS
jgi:rhomboid protease GluP